MIRRILFLVNFPFSKRDFRRFGIELLMQNGFEVEVWDLTNILYPEVRKNYIFSDLIDWPHCKVFDDKKTALDKIRSLSPDTFIIVKFHYFQERHSLYKAVSDSKAEYAVVMSNAVPPPEANRKQSISSYLRKLKRFKVKGLIDRLLLKLPLTWLGIKPAKFILVGGERLLKHSYIANKTTKIVWAHAFDYDIYLEERMMPAVEQPIAVFLDSYVPFHPDRCLTKTGFPILADKYYTLLNNIFVIIEDKLGLEVVIAVHPSSHYETHPDYFRGRKLVKGKTAKLVRESRLVLAHYSTALNFVNLFKKPVTFLTFSEIATQYQGHLTSAVAKWFGKEPIFMENGSDIDWRSELTVSKRHYDNYRKAYIKTEDSEDLPYWQIVANKLKERS